jgi:haloalkane dehalogenase
MFKTFRSPAGDEVVLDKNVFVERVLPASIIRELSGEEMDAYKAPFLNAGEDRRPTLTWPRQIPIEGEPEDVCAIVRNYGQHLSKSNIPKLFIEANPGMILKGNLAKYAKTWPNQTHASVKGLHFIQEDSPVEIADAISAWIENFS